MCFCSIFIFLRSWVPTFATWRAKWMCPLRYAFWARIFLLSHCNPLLHILQPTDEYRRLPDFIVQDLLDCFHFTARTHPELLHENLTVDHVVILLVRIRT